MSPRRIALLTLALLLSLCTTAAAAPLTGSSYDTGDGNQIDAVSQDWQGAVAAGRVIPSPDANDDCFVGGVKELAPKDWAFNRSAGGCTPGKSNLRVGFANAETTPATSFGHFGFFRNDTTGNSFLTFELNQGKTSWTNTAGTTIPCRSNGDLLLSFEVGGSSLTSSVYKWRGDFNPAVGHPCPYGGSGTFTGSGTLAPGATFQGTMNTASPIQSFVDPATYGATFPTNSFGEAAIDLPAVLQTMGESPCFGFLQMQIHSRSSSSISSAMIDYTTPVPVSFQSCAATGTVYQDSNGNHVRDGGEPGLAGFTHYADLDDDGVKDVGEPEGESDAKGFFRLLNVPSGNVRIRQVPRAGWACSQPQPCAYLRSVPVNGNSVGNDFGVLGPSTASGTTFDDLDGDGVRDAGEPGRPGVTLFADLDDDATLDAGEPTGTSDVDGAFTVTDVPAGTYRIRPALTGGWTCSTPSPCSAQRSFSSGSAETGLVFGSYGPVTIGGRVYDDANGDGAAFGAGDTGVSGRQVFLDANGNDAFDVGERQTTTDAGGLYSFTGLAPGDHVVRPASATGWYCTGPASCELAVSAQSAQTATGRDFALARHATVSGTVFDDPNGNGLFDSGETTGLAGFTHWVDYDGDNALDAGEPSAVSGAGGTFTITGVAAGSWTLRQQPNGAYECTSPVPCTSAVALGSGGAATGRVFRAYVSRSVSGTVFNDTDADGLAREAGEPGAGGFTVYSDEDNDSVHDAAEPVAVSNSLGVYNLTGLANGNYRIRIVDRSGWTCSFPASCLNTGSIGSGQSDTGMDFGLWGPATISGTAFDDADGDGLAREAGEAAVAGRAVWIDTTPNGVQDGGEPSSTTDASGAWSIGGLNPGTYTVRTSLAGATCTRPATCSYSVATASGALSGKDFGSYVPGTVAGVVRTDTDADGTGDTGLGGRTVFADANGNDTHDGGEAIATSAVDGSYTLTGLMPGSYVVRQVVPGGWTQSAPAAGHAIAVVSGAALTGRSFASWTTGSVSGSLYEDTDFDGSAKTGGDAPLDGEDVYLDLDDDRSHDPGEPRVTTDGSGDFAFPGLEPGAYRVRPVMPSGWACSFPSPCVTDAVVTSGVALGGNDFGGYEGASVSGTIFDDLDADGAVREAGEPGAAGRRVYLDGPGGTAGARDPHEPTMLTGAGGTFSFDGITAQAWTVRLELPAGWTCDSSPCSHALSLSSGQTVVGQELGVHTTGSISGHLFTDRDAQGDPQAFGENDQPERTVVLDLPGGGQRTAVTDDNGNFVFAGLEPGDYHVTQELPSGWTCSRPDPCAYDVTVTSGAAVTNRVFSSWTTASLTGMYFEDEDADGDYPEPVDGGLAGRPVYLDLNTSGTKDAGEPETTTAANGTYSFTGLQPRSYVVRSASPSADWSCSYPKDSPCATALTLEANERAQDVDFGAWTEGTVEGVVFRDLDGDGTRDAGEQGLSGRTVQAGAISAVTGAGGAYTLTLEPGTYTVTQVAVDGWACTQSPCSHSVTVTSGGAVTGRDFGNDIVPGTVSGTVTDDLDGDGSFDAGEPALSGLTVFWDADGDGAVSAGEPSDQTDAAGAYSLDVEPGTEDVRVLVGSSSHCTCAVSTAVASGASVTRSFSVWSDSTLSGVVFRDLDRDGAAREAGEPVLDDVDVFLDEGAQNGTHDAGEPRVTTAADGSYSFTGLAPGTRRVRPVLPSGWECTLPAPCFSDVALTSGSTPSAPDLGLAAVEADLGVTLARTPTALVAGRPVSWTVTVTNDGPFDAHGAEVVFALPAALRDVTWTPPAGVTCSAGTCVIGDLAAGDDVVIELAGVVAPDAAGVPFALEAAVDGDEPDPDATNDTASQAPVPDAIADLVAEAKLPDTAKVGDVVDLVVSARNDGPSDADELTLTATLPEGLDVESLPAGCTLAGRVVTCVATGLSVGDTLARTLKVKIGPGAGDRKLEVPVSAVSSTPDPTPADALADAAFTPTTSADVSVVVSSPPAATPEGYGYELTVHNEGPSPATEVVLFDGPFPGAHVVSATVENGTCSVESDGRLKCVIGTLAPGKDVRVAIVLVLDPGVDPATIQPAPAAKGRESDPTPADNRKTLALPPRADTRAEPLAITAPAPTACASLRAFDVHVRRRTGERFTAVRMWLRGTPLDVLRRDGRWTAQIDLRGRAAGRYKLTIYAKNARGRWLKGTRTYTTCTPRRRFRTPHL